LKRRRKLLFVLFFGVLAIDLAYLYAKTRPPEPEMVFDFDGNYTVAGWNDPAEIKNAIYLRSDGRWTLKSGKVVNPINVADLTIPNIDSPDYQVWVNSRQPITAGYTVKAVRSLAKLGVCNFVILAETEPSREPVPSSSVLTLDLWSDRQGSPL
jgi:hypothetical protein